jgi:hypothetical protein
MQYVAYIPVCMRPSVIVWGPGDRADLGGFAAASDLVSEPAADVRAALAAGSRTTRTIVCTGALVAPITSGSCQKAADR